MRKIIINICLLLTCLTTTAETRQNITAISDSITAEGNFQYWTSCSPTIATLRQYVADVCTEGSASFVPAEDRIAVFDMDGTIVSETIPYWSECMMFLYRVLEDTTYHAPDDIKSLARKIRRTILKGESTEPYLAAYDTATNRVYSGMSATEYEACVERFLRTDVPWMKNMKWGEIFFLPMVEVVAYLHANNFKTYIVTGSDRQFTRMLVNGVLKVESDHIIGTDVEYSMTGQDSTPSETYQLTDSDRMIRGKFVRYNTKSEKVTKIYREIGKQPIIAFGNSSGDYSMFRYTKQNKNYRSLAFCVLPDDTTREFGSKASSEKYRKICSESGWNVISMNEEFKSIYGANLPSPTYR